MSLVRLAGGAVAVGFSLGVLSCAGPGKGVEAAAPAPVQQVARTVERPALTLPPAREGLSERELWAEARRRAEGLAPLIEKDIAAVKVEPLPPPPPEPPKPTGAAPASPAAPAAPRPVEAVARAPQPEAVPAPARKPAGRARTAPVSDVRVARKYTTETGLPSNRITAVFVDDQDAWVGTADAGVARLNFAEGNWIITKAEDGLASNRVTQIVKYKGRVFVGTQEGISVWDGVSWAVRTEVGNVKTVNPVFRVHEGLLWVAARTMHGGLLTFDGEQWIDKSSIRTGTVLNNISDFDFSGDVLWIGTTNRGVYRFDGKEWTTFTVSDGIASNFVYTLGVRGGDCYLGGCCGVSAYENSAWSVYDIAEGLPHSTVNAIAVDGDFVWFGSKNGLALFDGYEFINFHTSQGLTDERITAIFVRGNEVWVGTANGLNRIEKGS